MIIEDERTERRRHHHHVRIGEQLEMLRKAPRDDAFEILATLLDAVYGDGFIRGVEDMRVQPIRGTVGQSTQMTTTGQADG